MAVLMMSAFPLMVDAIEENEPVGSGRANEVTVNNIDVITPPGSEKNGVYGNGFFPVEVNFTLAQELMNVNLTVNVTHGVGFENNSMGQGNLSADDYTFMSVQMFNFNDPGLYTINVSVDGWLNGTGMVIGYKEVADLNFSTIISYAIDININALEVDGIYGKEPIQIECLINNTGNGVVLSTNVSVEIKNVTSGTPEIFDTEGWTILGSLQPGEESNMITFFWIPSTEGATSIYNINITAKNVTSGKFNFSTVQLQVTNNTDLHLVSLNVPDDAAIIPGVSFPVGVYLNNTGNAKGKGDVRLLIYPEGQPGTILVDETETSEDIEPMAGTSGRLDDNEVMFMLEINGSGDFMIEARLIGTLEVLYENFTISQLPNLPPQLVNNSISPDPDAVTVTVGTIITFSVIYNDMDGDVGTVDLYIDDEQHTMLNETDEWDNDVVFTYSWTSTVGLHTYYFYAEDLLGENFTLMDGSEEFNFTVTQPTKGWLYGKVIDEDGNVSGAKMVIISTKLNETNTTVIDQFHNTTTDANGNYSANLVFSDLNYVVKIDKVWMEDNDYVGVDPDLKNIKLDLAHPEMWVNFTLASAVPPEETWLKGTVNDTDGNLSGVSVVVVIYVDEPGIMNVTIDGLNATVNTTTRTWMNITTTTDVNGSFELSGIPVTIPSVGDFPVTSTQVYRHDTDEVPLALSIGSWKVIARKATYTEANKVLEFKNGETTWWNLTLALIPPPMKYKITGSVSPAQTTVMIGTTLIEVDNASAFIIENLTNGDYTITFSADGYNTTVREVTIADADKALGKISLILIEDPDNLTTVYIGPFMDGDNAVVGITVSFTYNGIPYSSLTLADGRAAFDLPVMFIPDGTEITATMGDVEVKWDWGQTAPYESFTIDVEKEDDDSDVLLIVAIVIIVFIIIILVVLAMKSKGSEEEEDLFEEEARELECPGCGELVTSDMDSCPECGEELEFPEEEEELEGEEGEMEMEGEMGMEDELLEEPGEPGDLDLEDLDEEDEELEGVEEMAAELEEEELGAPDDMEEELDDLDDDLELEDL